MKRISRANREAVKHLFDSLATFLQVCFLEEAKCVAKEKRDFRPGSRQSG